ncbi:hypothetical protein GCM10011386_39150 [Parapedobacter defluvii]|uniref:TerB family tellurite resistance protein n=1 Tax=Parapedobacter defluvii TaxID=2045106 RepID=A0ABQ1MM97_9SPHI|nr:hypothetical protein [Parapedobacter defluvii]GGC43047.1 hypothetical protein GCM10011386_39150 [Parapedobacter defluvii]
MAFRIPDKAKQWFKHIQHKNSGFELEFDSYYFCLVLGISKGKKQSLPNAETTEFVQQFPNEYKPNRHLIIAMFLNAELKSLGISLEERSALNKQLTRLIDPISATGLSEEGMREMNRYAYGGFRELQNQFLEPPRTLDGFLVEYYQFLNT